MVVEVVRRDLAKRMEDDVLNNTRVDNGHTKSLIKELIRSGDRLQLVQEAEGEVGIGGALPAYRNISMPRTDVWIFSSSF